MQLILIWIILPLSHRSMDLLCIYKSLLSGTVHIQPFLMKQLKNQLGSFGCWKSFCLPYLFSINSQNFVLSEYCTGKHTLQDNSQISLFCMAEFPPHTQNLSWDKGGRLFKAALETCIFLSYLWSFRSLPFHGLSPQKFSHSFVKHQLSLAVVHCCLIHFSHLGNQEGWDLEGGNQIWEYTVIFPQCVGSSEGHHILSSRNSVYSSKIHAISSSL